MLMSKKEPDFPFHKNYEFPFTNLWLLERIEIEHNDMIEGEKK